MAKRKRLSPVTQEALQGAAPSEKREARSMFPSASPPIAQVAGDTAAQAALEEVTQELEAARGEGRMVLSLSLEAVDETYLVRDRIIADGAEFEALVASIRARGQQTPIEVVQLKEGRYGLISGWRRLTALRHLAAETGEVRFATVQALLRQPDSAADAYLAMVEENEIRLGLSYYERARIAAKALEQGVYDDKSAALRGLFGNASKARRSKIGSFWEIYAALDDDLRFAAAIPERLGLSLVKTLRAIPGARAKIVAALQKADPATSEEEIAVLTRATLAPEKGSGQKKESNSAKSEPHTQKIGALTLSYNPDRQDLHLRGKTLTPEKVRVLVEWLQEHG